MLLFGRGFCLFLPVSSLCFGHVCSVLDRVAVGVNVFLRATRVWVDFVLKQISRTFLGHELSPPPPTVYGPSRVADVETVPLPHLDFARTLVESTSRSFKSMPKIRVLCSFCVFIPSTLSCHRSIKKRTNAGTVQQCSSITSCCSDVSCVHPTHHLFYFLRRLSKTNTTGESSVTSY